MQGLVLLVTFLGMAVVSVVAAVFAGVIVDKLPAVHDMLSVLTFFGTLVVLLPICWMLAVRFTEPRPTA